jgi:hypothetical protein
MVKDDWRGPNYTKDEVAAQKLARELQDFYHNVGMTQVRVWVVRTPEGNLETRSNLTELMENVVDVEHRARNRYEN